MPDGAARPAEVGLLGGGVIGSGWAARFLLNGVDVRLYDPDPGAERKVLEVVENARRAMARLTLAPLPAEGRLAMVAAPEEAVEGAGFVQESAPERESLKQELLGAAARAAGPDVPICSSTSGLRPTRLQDGVPGPGRVAVGHPFNPVYLLPLVEVCGGEQTAPETLERAAEVYRSVGMRPLRVRREIDGFLADRLMEALWREALWLVADDVATAEEIDDAIRFGAGLRWSFMGTFLTFRIAGGEAGMRHFMAQFGPALEWPWTKLMDVPELTDELLEKLVAQSDAQAAGRPVRELERLRDDCLVAVLQGLRSQGAGAGEVLAEYERTLLGRNGSAPDPTPAAPLPLHRLRVPADWMDYNGHAHESRYLQAFADATDALLRRIGVDGEYVGSGASYFTVETHLTHLRAAVAGDVVEVSTQLLGHDEKRLHIFHRLVREADGEELACAEQMLVHVDTAHGRAAPAPPGLLERVAEIQAAHASLAWPERAGRRIGLEPR
jgi:carnitine 3-dehydrogenase